MHKKLLLFSLLSALLLFLAWPARGFTPLLFISWIPLLYVQHTIAGDTRYKAKHLFAYSYLTFLLWNISTTWWIWYASPGGAVMAIVCNALLMTITFMVYHKVRKKLPERLATFSLVPIWICFEYLHHDWDLSWPWLTLGNGMASMPQLIQWYEYTGIFGGSLWILLINILLFELYIHRNTLLREMRFKIIHISALSFLLIIPVVFSLLRYYNYNEISDNSKSIKTVVVQPNIDPYKKFSSDFKEQLESMLILGEQLTDTTTDYLVFPETALVEDFWENNLRNSWSIRRIDDFLKNYPHLKIVTGASTGRYYEQGEKISATARKFKHQEGYYDNYNTALQLDSNSIQIYHKSKLVPGVEKMPFPEFFHLFEDFAIDLGGTTGSLGMQNERTVFHSTGKNTGVAPVICYESIYGDYVGQYIRNGADFIFIITNDGWWDDTPGYRQHLQYGRIRAIETRKSIARSANTGISCFINQRGDIMQPTSWWVPAAIKQKITSSSGMTFYTRHGDYIAQFLSWITLLLVSYSLFAPLIKRFKKS